MIMRMYLKWAANEGFKSEILDTTEGEEAGIKNASLEIRGPNAYGYVKGEAGSHRLVRLSPFDSAHRRHTAFALVEVLPEIESDNEIDLKVDDVRVDTYRASGGRWTACQQDVLGRPPDTYADGHRRHVPERA